MNQPKALLFFLLITAVIGVFAFSHFTGTPIVLPNSSLKPATSASPSPSESPLPSPTSPTAPSASSLTPLTKKWLLAAGGVLTAHNQDSFNELTVTTPVDVEKNRLADAWGITDHDTAVNKMLWLEQSGHSEEFNKLRDYIISKTNNDPAIFQKIRPQLVQQLSPIANITAQTFLVDFTWQLRDELAQKSLRAWDDIRDINVARWAYTVGYISQDEAWAHMLTAGQDLQTHFSSWDETTANYMLGRDFWLRSYDNVLLNDGVIWLHENPSSPWRTLQWDTKLGS